MLLCLEESILNMVREEWPGRNGDPEGRRVDPAGGTSRNAIGSQAFLLHIVTLGIGLIPKDMILRF